MKISAIMPTANRARFVPASIACFLAQTHADRELVILDDGEQSIAHLVPEDPRVRYFRELPRRTTGEKRNRCSELATGEVIAHWDDDDWSAPDRLAYQLAILLSDPSKTMTGFCSILFWDDERQKGFRWSHTYHALGTSQMYLRSWWSKNPISTRQIGEDMDYSHRANRAKVLLSVPSDGKLVARLHGERTSTTPRDHPVFRPVDRAEFPESFWPCASI